jgi:hypothetical protein
MAVICAHCGTGNPDANTICMSCGMPLVDTPYEASATGTAATGTAATSPAADLPGFALPVLDQPAATPTGAGATHIATADALNYLPPGYVTGMNPYLPPPAAGAAPIHRTGRLSIVAVVGVISVVFGGAGAVVAALRTGATTPTPVASAPANVLTSPGDGTPTFPSTQTATAGSIITTPFATVFLPSGFSVNDKGSDYIVLTPDSSSGDALGLQSEPLSHTSTNAQLDQDLLAGYQQNGDPSARFCNDMAPTHTTLMGLGGPIAADAISICENVTPTVGPAFAAVDGFVDAVTKSANGTLEAIWVEIFAPTSEYQSFSNSLPAAVFQQTTFTNAGPLA